MELKDKLDSFKLKELLESLYLPKLKYDLDSVPIENEFFVDYQWNVEQNLPLLFDFVQQQKQFVYDNKELHSSLILLLCELAADTMFRISNERLLQNVRRLLDEHKNLNAAVEALIFDYYKDKLKQDTWKVYLGAVHGFVHFLEHFYKNEASATQKLEGRWLNFSLAVALNVRDCHENAYKQLGIKIFLIILQHARPEDIREINVHSVIYNSVLKDVHIMDDTAAVKNIWNTLLICLEFFEHIDSISWSKVDDLLEILVRNIPLSNTAAISACMLGYVTKLCVFFTINRLDISQSIEAALADSAELENCRNACLSNTSYTNFRWAKSILDLIIFECHKLMQNLDTCLHLLRAMHICYLVAISPIPITVVKPHLLVFYDKFTAVLMELINKFKNHELVIKETKNILDTFNWQLKQANCDAKNGQLLNYQTAFQALGRNKIFGNITG